MAQFLHPPRQQSLASFSRLTRPEPFLKVFLPPPLPLEPIFVKIPQSTTKFIVLSLASFINLRASRGCAPRPLHKNNLSHLNLNHS